MDDIERRIVNALQGGFPLCERPFAAAAARLGIDEATLLAKLEALLARGVLTRFGPLYDVERMGGAFSLCAISVPPAELERVAAIVNAHPEVAHNYERAHAYNMWFVLAARSRAALRSAIEKIEAETRCAVMELPRLDEYFIELRLTA